MAKTAAKRPAKFSAASAQPATPRRLKKPTYQSFKLHKRIKPEVVLPGAFKLFGRAAKVFGQHWKLFGGIVVVYGVLNMLLVRGFSSGSDFTSVKTTLDNALSGGVGHLATALSAFAYLVSSSGNNNSPTAGVYQLFLVLVVSLALIWTLRQVYAGTKVRIRDGFYLGSTPLVPFLLVLLVVCLQLVPMVAGIFLYNTLSSGDLLVTAAEKVIAVLLAGGLTLLSIYMIASSLFALYIVCLPGMTPLKALRSARELVRYRRWAVVRKVVFLPIALLVVAAVLMVPFILFATALAPWMFFVLSMALLAAAHGYLYGLYRALL